ncbi:MAG: ABC transporter substrate-binding protein [Alphaproteobacteria bacterium]|nr:ABC transporter substrate-binding protein [Alphaproteobacteria bacterium]
MIKTVYGALAAIAVVCALAAAEARDLIEPPALAQEVAEGKLPPIAERVPTEPRVISLTGDTAPGAYGGDLRMLIGRSQDVRLLVAYGYARILTYEPSFALVPDIAADVEVADGRTFTIRLRPGHKWSDGHPFTTEDFRYYWEDVANNAELSPSGPPIEMLVGGERPTVEVVDETTIRYGWSRANPFFLPALARAASLYIFRPAHYLKRFHAKYADPEALRLKAKAESKASWAALHNGLDNLYKFDNPALPTLEPWMNTTRPPATRFVAKRNPYFHRIDENGRQLPYIDRVLLSVADPKLIPAKAGAGEVDLQSRAISFSNYTFLKENEERNDFTTRLWRTAKGAHLALFPNLNHNDPGWRALFRDVRFRHALSLAIDRELINESLYYGLAIASNNTVLAESPLFEPEYQSAWASYDPDQASALLDEIGLTERDGEGTRLMPDGRPLNVIVETAGEDTEQTDVLELIRENWAAVGIKLFTRPSQREVFRNRVFAGETLVSIWSGLENGVPTADMSPEELTPVHQLSLQWPKWGQHYETGGASGEAPDTPEAKELLQLQQAWLDAQTAEERADIWHRILAIHAEQTFTIGIVAAVMQPIVVNRRLMNVPEEGVYNWDPGAQFGMYRPDTFWFASE